MDRPGSRMPNVFTVDAAHPTVLGVRICARFATIVRIVIAVLVTGYALPDRAYSLRVTPCDCNVVGSTRNAAVSRATVGGVSLIYAGEITRVELAILFRASAARRIGIRVHDERARPRSERNDGQKKRDSKNDTDPVQNDPSNPNPTWFGETKASGFTPGPGGFSSLSFCWTMGLVM